MARKRVGQMSWLDASASRVRGDRRDKLSEISGLLDWSGFASRRRPVEKLFGTLKRSYRLDRVPYFNQARNAVALIMACFAYNLRRCYALSAP